MGTSPNPIRINGKYDRLTVLAYSHNNGQGKMWKCRCVCGTITYVKTAALNNKTTRSCGCLQKDFARDHIRNVGIRNTKHGQAGTQAYHSWRNMMMRCYDETRDDFHRYGGRGISVCGEWHKFDAFFADMGQPPEAGMQLDRIDNESGYSPDNCRWTTRKIQCRNRRSNVQLTYQGRTQCMFDWAAEFGMSGKQLHKRLTLGWDLETALTTPVKQLREDRELTYGGRTMKISEWAKVLKVRKGLLFGRIASGWSDAKVIATPVRNNGRN